MAPRSYGLRGVSLSRARRRLSAQGRGARAEREGGEAHGQLGLRLERLLLHLLDQRRELARAERLGDPERLAHGAGRDDSGRVRAWPDMKMTGNSGRCSRSSSANSTPSASGSDDVGEEQVHAPPTPWRSRLRTSLLHDRPPRPRGLACGGCAGPPGVRPPRPRRPGRTRCRSAATGHVGSSEHAPLGVTDLARSGQRKAGAARRGQAAPRSVVPVPSSLVSASCGRRTGGRGRRPSAARARCRPDFVVKNGSKARSATARGMPHPVS